MTDYEIQKANDDKVGVVSSPDNIFECRKAILEKLGGDSTNADTIYECDKRILPLIGSGSANQQEKNVNITENGTTSVLPDEGYSLSKVDVNVNVKPPKALIDAEQVRFTNVSVIDDNIDFVGLKRVSQMFYNSPSLTSIPKLDMSDVTNVSGMFRNCTSLTDLGGLINLGMAFTRAQTLDLSSLPLTNQSVQNIIDTVYDMNLNTKVGRAILRLNKTVIDAMTYEQKHQLSSKGWQLIS